MKDFPIEILETRYPLRIRHYGFRPDSAGAGKWRGGNGIVREWVVECDEACLSLWCERSKTPAWGLFDGETAEPSYVLLNPGTDRERRMQKVNRMRLSRGDVIRCLSGGGGGFGDASQRDRTAVEADLVQELHSPEFAARAYGDRGE